MDMKERLWVIPSVGIAAAALGYTSGIVWQNENVIQPAQDDKRCIEDLPKPDEEVDRLLACDGLIIELYGKPQQKTEGYVNPDGVIIKRETRDTYLAEYDTILANAEARVEESVDERGEFAKKSAILAVSGLGLAVLALRINKLRRKHQANKGPKHMNRFRKTFRSMTSMPASESIDADATPADKPKELIDEPV